MKILALKRWAGLAVAALVIGAPLAALAQNSTNAAPAPAAAANSATNAAAPAPAASAPSPCTKTNNCATQSYPKDSVNAGDTAWMLTSSVLVLMMTIPGLALFYAGMVRKKNILDTLAQSFGATCVITVTWMVIGYSIA
ncbi:MAG TPA: ammonia channel protein, partial [Caulobacteraceae bacterium]